MWTVWMLHMQIRHWDNRDGQYLYGFYMQSCLSIWTVCYVLRPHWKICVLGVTRPTVFRRLDYLLFCYAHVQVDSAHTFRSTLVGHKPWLTTCVTMAVGAKVIVNGRIVSVLLSATLSEVFDSLGVECGSCDHICVRAANAISSYQYEAALDNTAMVCSEFSWKCFFTLPLVIYPLSVLTVPVMLHQFSCPEIKHVWIACQLCQRVTKTSLWLARTDCSAT